MFPLKTRGLMWRRWGPKGGLVSEAPWGPRLILAATSKLPSEKTEKCNTGSYWWSNSASFAPKSVLDIWYWPTTTL